MTVDGQVTMEEVNQLAVTTGLQPGINAIKLLLPVICEIL
jgi:hypothetical protein